MPRSALNFLLVLTSAALFRFLVWHLFGIQIENIELWSVLGLGVMAATIYQFLPESSKQWLSGIITKILTTSILTKIALITVSVFILLTGSLSVVEVKHQTDVSTEILINGQNTSIRPKDGPSTRKIGFAFQNITIECGTFFEQVRFVPLLKRKVEIPFDSLVSQSMPIMKIEGELIKTLFQFYETDYFQSAKELIRAASESTESKLSIERVAKIQQILELAIVGPDPSSSRDILIAEFEEKFPSDRWLALLKATSRYCGGNYLVAVELLQQDAIRSNGDFGHASVFFRGICLMRAARSIEGETQILTLKHARKDFEDSEAYFSERPSSSLARLSLPSSIIFQAILSFYEKDLSNAQKQFERAAITASGSMKARALNGKGYVLFIEGKLANAELALQAALEADSTFAYARSNYGYVLLARNAPNEAIRYFEANSTDAALAKRSPRDVLLARLAATHAAETLGVPIEKIVQAYASSMRDYGFRDFSGVIPIELRLAYLYCEMAESVYLGKDYYGLEPFALALLGKALAEIDKLPNSLVVDLRVKALRAQIENQSSLALRNVSPEWLVAGDHGSFFSHVGRFHNNKSNKSVDTTR